MKALNTQTGLIQNVSPNVINNPHVFGGIFISPPATDTAPPSSGKKSSRTPAGHVETTDVALAADATASTPAPAGDTEPKE